jgi:hypothetical protein
MQVGIVWNKIGKIRLHCNSKGVLHAASRAVTSASYFDGNHGSKELYTYVTLTRKEL